MSTLADLYKIASEEKDRSSVIMPAAEGASSIAAIGAAGVAGKKALDKVKNVKESGKAIDENKKTIAALQEKALNEKALHRELGEKLDELDNSNKGVLNRIKNAIKGNNVNAQKEALKNNRKELLKEVAKSLTASDALASSNKAIEDFAKANKKAGLLYGLGAAGLTAAGIGLGAHSAKSFIGEQNN